MSRSDQDVGLPTLDPPGVLFDPFDPQLVLHSLEDAHDQGVVGHSLFNIINSASSASSRRRRRSISIRTSKNTSSSTTHVNDDSLQWETLIQKQWYNGHYVDPQMEEGFMCFFFLATISRGGSLVMGLVVATSSCYYVLVSYKEFGRTLPGLVYWMIALGVLGISTLVLIVDLCSLSTRRERALALQRLQQQDNDGPTSLDGSAQDDHYATPQEQLDVLKSDIHNQRVWKAKFAEKISFCVILGMASLATFRFFFTFGPYCDPNTTLRRCQEGLPMSAVLVLCASNVFGPRLPFLVIAGLATITSLVISHQLATKNPENGKTGVVSELMSRNVFAVAVFGVFWSIILRAALERLKRSMYESQLRLAIERNHAAARKEQVNQMLENMLPPTVLSRLLQRETPDDVQEATILVSDVCGFTSWCSTRTALQVVHMLSTVISDFDTLALEAGVIRIKTMGDGYLAACGIPVPVDDHAGRMLRFASQMHHSLTVSSSSRRDWGPLTMRIGVHSGQVIGMMLSMQRWAYDVSGPVPSLAGVLEQNGPVGNVLFTKTTKRLLSSAWTNLVVPSMVQVEAAGKGLLYQLTSIADVRSAKWSLSRRHGLRRAKPSNEPLLAASPTAASLHPDEGKLHQSPTPVMMMDGMTDRRGYLDGLFEQAEALQSVEQIASSRVGMLMVESLSVSRNPMMESMSMSPQSNKSFPDPASCSPLLSEHTTTTTLHSASDRGAANLPESENEDDEKKRASQQLAPFSKHSPEWNPLVAEHSLYSADGDASNQLPEPEKEDDDKNEEVAEKPEEGERLAEWQTAVLNLTEVQRLNHLGTVLLFAMATFLLILNVVERWDNLTWYSLGTKGLLGVVALVAAAPLVPPATRWKLAMGSLAVLIIPITVTDALNAENPVPGRICLLLSLPMFFFVAPSIPYAASFIAIPLAWGVGHFLSPGGTTFLYIGVSPALLVAAMVHYQIKNQLLQYHRSSLVLEGVLVEAQSEIEVLSRLMKLKMPEYVIEQLIEKLSNAPPTHASALALCSRNDKHVMHEFSQAVVAFLRFDSTQPAPAVAIPSSGSTPAPAATIMAGPSSSPSQLLHQQAFKLMALQRSASAWVDDLFTVTDLLDKVKTMGDTFLIAGPIRPKKRSEDDEDGFAVDMSDQQQTDVAAVELVQKLKMLHDRLDSEEHGTKGISVRVGVAVGPVIAAVLGKSQLEFDVFGTTVNLASRLMNSTPSAPFGVQSEQSAFFTESDDEGDTREERKGTTSSDQEDPLGVAANPLTHRVSADFASRLPDEISFAVGITGETLLAFSTRQTEQRQGGGTLGGSQTQTQMLKTKASLLSEPITLSLKGLGAKEAVDLNFGF